VKVSFTTGIGKRVHALVLTYSQCRLNNISKCSNCYGLRAL